MLGRVAEPLLVCGEILLGFFRTQKEDLIVRILSAFGIKVAVGGRRQMGNDDLLLLLIGKRSLIEFAIQPASRVAFRPRDRGVFLTVFAHIQRIFTDDQGLAFFVDLDHLPLDRVAVIGPELELISHLQFRFLLKKRAAAGRNQCGKYHQHD